ncbi:MAG: hypothetical protein FJ109_20115 [Deltaproteobacteria bacterium]|nr:hypothetical protein [Deltaproteobacteria bacterium]
MSENVKCPACGKQARWMGCVGCGDDSGTLVCQACGVAIPGVTLGELVQSSGACGSAIGTQPVVQGGGHEAD